MWCDSGPLDRAEVALRSKRRIQQRETGVNLER